MKRDILNYLDEKIGELEMPDNTPEEDWVKELSKYSQAPEVIIPNCTPRQIRQALFIYYGVTAAMIEAGIAQLPEPHKTLAMIEWEYSTLFIRSNHLVDMLGQLMGWTSGQIDSLWIEANKL